MDPIVENKTLPKNELIIRMERNNKMFQRLAQKLNSYTCEPKCQSGFEQFHGLKQDFRTFAKQQKQLMARVQDKKNGISDPLATEIRTHLKRYIELERAFTKYLWERNLCH